MSNISKLIKPTPAAKTLKEAAMRGLVKAIKVVGFIAIGFLMVHWLTGGQDEIINGTFPDRDQQVMDIREPAKHSPAAVLSAHEDECWNAQQNPKADLPGAAIVQFNNGKTIYTKNHKLVDAAFNEALAAIGFGDKTSDKIEVIALCI